MKQKKMILILVILIIALGVTILFNYERIKGFIYLNCISYDMELSYYTPQELGGYATITTYHRINTKKKKEYIIKDFDVYGTTRLGEKGSHYSLEQKDLTDEQINKLKEYAYGESTYKSSSSKSIVDVLDNRDRYVTIRYDGQSKSYYMSDFNY